MLISQVGRRAIALGDDPRSQWVGVGECADEAGASLKPALDAMRAELIALEQLKDKRDT